MVTIDPSPVDSNSNSSANQPSLQQGVFGSQSILDKGFLVWVNEQNEGQEADSVKSREGGRPHTIVLKGQIPVDVSLDRDQLSLTLPAVTRFKNIHRNPATRSSGKNQRQCHHAYHTTDRRRGRHSR